MGQINLYKIDGDKKAEFFDRLNEKFECVGCEEYTGISNDEVSYEVGTYINIPEEKGKLSWQWILDIYDYAKIEIASNPKAVLVVEDKECVYAITYGMSFFVVDKYCDVNFAFDFARRIKLKQINTTTLTAPNAQRNKLINVYVNYNELEFDSGESFAKIKAKADLEQEFTVHGETVEIGHSIKTNILEDSIDSILRMIEYVKDVAEKEELHKIPVFSKVRDKQILEELDNELKEKIDEDIECINISELDIIGATEIFNNNDATFTLKYKYGKQKEIEELSKNNILQFIEENNLKVKDDFLDIKVISNKNNNPVCTETIRKMIDYTNDTKRCLLLKGDWFLFNDDYVQYLKDSILEIPIKYNPEYDFSTVQKDEYVSRKYEIEKSLPVYKDLDEAAIKKKMKDKYYAERVFNCIMEEEHGFQNYDRCEEKIGGEKIELMDLYKDKTMFAVKIGNASSKLSYAVDQSISSTKAYKHKMLENMPEIENVAVWIILKNREHLPILNDQLDLTQLHMIMLKNRLDTWKKEIRLLGYKPVIYINYWD